VIPAGPGLELSLAIFLIALAIGGLANWQLRRDYLHRIRGVPWFGVQFVAAAICLVIAAHLVTLMTGHDLHSSRGGY
jgi:hypothetical protein